MTTTPQRNLTAKQWIGVWAVLTIGVVAQYPDAWEGALIVFIPASLLMVGMQKFNERASIKQFFYGAAAFFIFSTVLSMGWAIFITTTFGTLLFSAVALLSAVSAAMMFAFGWFEQ